MQSLAVLIPGNLNRNSKRFFKNNFFSKLKNYDLFISTYQEDQSYIKLMNKSKIKYLNIENYNELKEKKIFVNSKNYKFKDINSPIYQWYHLDKILNENLSLLRNYDLIIKVRPDMYFECPKSLHKIKLDKRSIYSFTDCLFYGSSSHFLEVFSSFYENILTKYFESDKKYFPINYSNILESEINFSEPNNLSRLNLPKFILNSDITVTKKIIKSNLTFLNKNIFKNNEISTKKKNANLIFRSEASFLYQVLNSGTIKKCHLRCARPRKFFNGFIFKNFPNLDKALVFIKNLLNIFINIMKKSRADIH